jgi:lambda family phage portal protein
MRWPWRPAAAAVRHEPTLAVPARLGATRTFAAARTDLPRAGWITQRPSLDAALRGDLRILRSRARQLEEDDDYAKRFLQIVRNNVVGRGIQLQAQTLTAGGEADAPARAALEEAWAAWGRPGECDVTGKLSWGDVQRLAIVGLARDGEAILRLVPGAPNAARFALQVVPPETLNEEHNRELGGGREIRMGVELDAMKRPVAYHLSTEDPNDAWRRRGIARTERVPAERIVHLFVQFRAWQTRGVPWMHTAQSRLNMLGGYEENEMVASRAASAKMGFYTSEGGDEERADEIDAEGNLIEDARPGHFERLPKGVEFTAFDPQHPTQQFGAFVKAILRGAAAGLGVNYVTLTGDLEAVNYSSIRAGRLEERDEWQVLQDWLVERMHARVFEAWLPHGLLAAGLALTDEERYRRVAWQPRGWEWVDPEAEVNAKLKEIGAGLTSRTAVLASRGADFADVLAQLKAEQDLAASMGVALTLETTARPKEEANGQAQGQGQPDPDRHALSARAA